MICPCTRCGRSLDTKKARACNIYLPSGRTTGWLCPRCQAETADISPEYLPPLPKRGDVFRNASGGQIKIVDVDHPVSVKGWQVGQWQVAFDDGDLVRCHDWADVANMLNVDGYQKEAKE